MTVLRPHLSTFLSLALAALLAPAVGKTATSPAEACSLAQDQRPRIGLVLGGGGARGAAHVGVIKALESLRVPVDYIAGTSMGSIIGGLLATGMTGAEIEEEMNRVNWDVLFTDQPRRTERRFRRKRDDDLDLFGPRLGYKEGELILPEGALVGQKVNLLLKRVTLGSSYQEDFDRLPIPFRAVAADIVTGNEVVLDRGDLALAMRASMSIPGAFWPVADGDRLLVDGGIVNNLPIQIIRDMGADIIIAVDVRSPLFTRDELGDLFDMVEQLTNLLVAQSTESQTRLLRAADTLLVPDLTDTLSSVDFERFPDAIPVGERTTLAAADRLTPYALSEADYARYRRSVTACQRPAGTVQWVEVNNQSAYSDEMILERLGVQTGQPLDFVALEEEIDRIYGLGHLREVRYHLERKDDELGVVVDVLPDRRAPNLIEYGLSFFSDADDNAFNLRVGLLKTDIDPLGGEWRTVAQIGEEPYLFSELYKPFNPSSPWYLTARAQLERDKVRLFAGDQPEAEILVDSATLELSGGKEFGNSADLAVGVRLGTGDTEVSVGDPELPDVSFDAGQWFVRFRYDHIDDLFFPNTGGFGSFEFHSESQTLGADQDFQQAELQYFYNWKPGDRHHLLLGGTFNTTIDSDAPIYGLYRAGGFGRLSGLEFNQISGQHLAVGLAGYRYSLASGGLFPAYLGGTVELGNVWDRRSDISFDSSLLHGSLYFGFRSPLGPLYVGLGYGESGEGTFFVRLGDIFSEE
ncbi:MAG: patatin-like phospholipase family protein [Pseudomonadota bacterium]